MLNNLKEKMSSWALWLSIASLITFCIKEFSGVDIDATVDNFLNVLLPVLVGFGIINNPNSKSSM